MYAQLSWELTWKKRYVYIHHRDIFVCSRMGVNIIIQDQRFVEAGIRPENASLMPEAVFTDVIWHC